MYDNQQPMDIVKSGHAKLCDEYTIEYTLYRGTSTSRTAYSIEAIITENNEAALVQDITDDAVKAEYIFDMITKGKVTPCCIFEITEDLIESMPQEIRLTLQDEP